MPFRQSLQPWEIEAPQNSIDTPCTITFGNTQPADPKEGDVWIDTA